MTLDALNARADDEAVAALLACCGSREWARRVAADRPFATADDLLAAAERIWWSLEPRDWLEAFAAHPPIGGDARQAGAPARARAWSAGEQAGARETAAAVRDALADLNRAYHARFGYIFNICATGRSGREMLEALRARLPNDPATELRVAAAEQAKITTVRLQKLLQ